MDAATNKSNTDLTAIADAEQTKSTKFNRVQFQFDGKDKIAALFAGGIFDSPAICGKDAKT